MTAESTLGVGTTFIINLKTKCKVQKQAGFESSLPFEFVKSVVKGDSL